MHTKIHFMGSAKPAAQQAVQQLIDRYGQSEIAAASYVVTVGGDGTALRALHALLPMREKAVFAMRLPDSVGALGNPFHLENLAERLRATRRTSIRLLTAEATLLNGDSVTGLGINEIVVSRQALQAAKLYVRAGEASRYREIIGDKVGL